MRRVRESPPRARRPPAFCRVSPTGSSFSKGLASTPSGTSTGCSLRRPICNAPKLVMAGRHRRNQDFARSSVKRLARSRGKGVRWQQRYGVATAPWHNLDRTPRTIALLSTHHFSITRRQDLQRVLAMTKARELRDAKKEGLVAARGPDALLSMGPEEAISLEVEGVHRFIVGSIKHVPVRLRLAVRETGADQATVSVLATYPSPSDASDAVGLLEESRAVLFAAAHHDARGLWEDPSPDGAHARRGSRPGVVHPQRRSDSLHPQLRRGSTTRRSSCKAKRKTNRNRPKQKRGPEGPFFSIRSLSDLEDEVLELLERRCANLL